MELQIDDAERAIIVHSLHVRHTTLAVEKGHHGPKATAELHKRDAEQDVIRHLLRKLGEDV